MRIVLLIIFALRVSAVQAQEYRLGYEGASLPELYNQAYIFAEEKIGNEYRKLPQKKYKLHTTDATLKDNLLRYDRQRLYSNNGVVRFVMTINNRQVPLTLDLPVLQEIRYNPFTDSIKPILNYYVNVEGKFSTGRIFPLDTSFITITSDHGHMQGLEWILPKERNFEKVTFEITSKFDPSVRKTLTLYLKKQKDARDAPGYQEQTEEEIIERYRKRR